MEEIEIEMVYRNVGKNAESMMGISSSDSCTLCPVALIFFQVFFKTNYEKNMVF